MCNTLITLPPLPEQESIAQFLDEKCARIDEAIRIKEKQIDLLKEYRQIAIHQAVTKGLNDKVKMKDSGIDWIGGIPEHWEVKRLKYVCQNLNNRRVPLETTIRGMMENRSYEYYGATGVIDYVENYIFDEETILIAEDGANLVLRNLQLVYKPKGKYWVNNHAHILKPFENYLLDFVAYSLEEFDYTNYISGAAQPKLTKENLMNIWLVVPPITDQTQIITHLESLTTKTDEAVRLKEQQIEQLKQYKTSLINDVVTGKVRVA